MKKYYLLAVLAFCFHVLRPDQAADRIGDGPVSCAMSRSTRSRPRTRTRFPSTKKQFDLANLLEKELNDLGVQNVRVSEFGIVYGMVPGNLADNSKVPTIGFIAHMDTSPAVSGANVNAIIHKNYQGGDIVLPNDKTQIITVDEKSRS